MTKLSDVLRVLEQIAPLKLAETWDNVGLIVGDRSQRVSNAMLTIDYTPEVAAEAKDAGCELVIAYHPPIFKGHKRVVAHGPTELVFDAIRRGVAIYSPHTALDVADGGTNDVLADGLALVDRRPLRINEAKPIHHKLIVFVPTDAVDKVSRALWDAGAGHIGNYSCCSFRSPGVGTFIGEAGSHPTKGAQGKFEQVDEVRLEVLIPINGAAAAVQALKRSHPYEEVAFDLQMLAGSLSTIGIGRIGRLPGEITLEMVSNLLKRSINVNHLLVAGASDTMIKTVALCAGSGGEFVRDVIEHRADLYVTGELRHHDVLKLNRAGVAVICTLHTNSERAALARLAERLREQVKEVRFTLSATDRDPFEIV